MAKLSLTVIYFNNNFFLENLIDKYIEHSTDLNCNLKKPCLWANADSDRLLDTSDFYLFNKTDWTVFPIQIHPGNMNPSPGK